eukprot:m.182362 g.182362  ORF g.182362 m.182362 type:complete len:175 (+) comp39294_c0_seq9:367-891(+)
MTAIENCYYHGKIRGYADSNVIVRTCNGLSGIFYHGKEADNFFYIEPAESGGDEGHVHTVYRASDLADGSPIHMCGDNHSHVIFSPPMPRAEQDHVHLRPRTRRSVTSEEKVVELVLVNDNRQFVSRGSSVADTAARSASVVNLIDGVFFLREHSDVLLLYYCGFSITRRSTPE